MKAMVLAAGLGTRLRPLTDSRPKALVEVGGRTLLEIALERLRLFGIQEVIVNVHHFADMMVDYLSSNRNFGMRIEISREELLLDTGGGLKQAAWFFNGDAEPFVLLFGAGATAAAAGFGQAPHEPNRPSLPNVCAYVKHWLPCFAGP